MNIRTWCFSAVTGAFLIGSLLGVGCKSSSSANVSATKTAETMKTQEMMHETPTAENMMHETPTAENMMHETPTP